VDEHERRPCAPDEVADAAEAPLLESVENPFGFRHVPGIFFG
jgi:hypothetical protein